MTAATRGRKPSTLPADPDALVKAPPAPAELGAHAKAEWKRVAPLLVKRGVLTKTDLGGLESYCAAFGFAKKIADDLVATGTLPDPKLAGVQIRFATLARQLAAEFGLSPVARSRIGTATAEDDDADNPLAV